MIWDHIGENRRPEIGKAGRFAIAVDRKHRHLRAESLDCARHEGPAAKLQESLVLAHPAAQATGDHAARNLF
jgi:hypothetical protein